MRQTQRKKEKGLILLEAIIAVGVLTTMFAATMALFSNSVVGVRLSSDQLIATYLAQDAMEMVIAKQQFNIDNFFPWLTNINNCIGQTCAMDYFFTETDVSIEPLTCANPLTNGCKLYFDGAVYTSTDPGGAAETQYTRTAEITVIGHEAHVRVDVSWPNGEDTMVFTLHHTLYEYDTN